jgi:hypothetical protein
VQRRKILFLKRIKGAVSSSSPLYSYLLARLHGPPICLFFVRYVILGVRNIYKCIAIQCLDMHIDRSHCSNKSGFPVRENSQPHSVGGESGKVDEIGYLCLYVFKFFCFCRRRAVVVIIN